MSVRPKISIITVVFNSEEFIESTIQSIINQSYKDFEYIIIDGKSNDKTVDIIKSYESNIAYWISEPDNGLYDAMNKGIRVAKGEYILFINSGDKLFDLSTLENVFNQPEADVYYGNTMIINEANEDLGYRRIKPPDNLTFKSLKKGMVVCHQSFIAKKSLVSLFNLNYSFSSDYDWIICIVKNAETVTNTDLVISRFMEGGRTSNTVYKGLSERFIIMKKHYGFISATMLNIVLIPRFLAYLFTKQI